MTNRLSQITSISSWNNNTSVFEKVATREQWHNFLSSWDHYWSCSKWHFTLEHVKYIIVAEVNRHIWSCDILLEWGKQIFQHFYTSEQSHFELCHVSRFRQNNFPILDGHISSYFTFLNLDKITSPFLIDTLQVISLRSI